MACSIILFVVVVAVVPFDMEFSKYIVIIWYHFSEKDVFLKKFVHDNIYQTLFTK